MRKTLILCSITITMQSIIDSAICVVSLSKSPNQYVMFNFLSYVNVTWSMEMKQEVLLKGIHTLNDIMPRARGIQCQERWSPGNQLDVGNLWFSSNGGINTHIFSLTCVYCVKCAGEEVVSSRQYHRQNNLITGAGFTIHIIACMSSTIFFISVSQIFVILTILTKSSTNSICFGLYIKVNIAFVIKWWNIASSKLKSFLKPGDNETMCI